MSINRTAKAIVLIPCLLLGGAFLSAGVWGAQENETLAYGLGAFLISGGLLAQWLPNGSYKEKP
jgi:hypothetical protein